MRIITLLVFLSLFITIYSISINTLGRISESKGISNQNPKNKYYRRLDDDGHDDDDDDDKRDGKGKDGKGRDGKGRDGKGGDGKGRDGNQGKEGGKQNNGDEKGKDKGKQGSGGQGRGKDGQQGKQGQGKQNGWGKDNGGQPIWSDQEPYVCKLDGKRKQQQEGPKNKDRQLDEEYSSAEEEEQDEEDEEQYEEEEEEYEEEEATSSDLIDAATQTGEHFGRLAGQCTGKYAGALYGSRWTFKMAKQYLFAVYSSRKWTSQEVMNFKRNVIDVVIQEGANAGSEAGAHKGGDAGADAGRDAGHQVGQNTTDLSGDLNQAINQGRQAGISAGEKAGFQAGAQAGREIGKQIGLKVAQDAVLIFLNPQPK